MRKADVTIEEIYPIVQKTVSNQAGSVARFGESAEDITQDVMIKIYKNWDSFRGDCQVSSWIYSVVKNTIINIAIKHGREKRRAVAVYSIEDNELDFEDEEQGSLEDNILYDEKVMKLVELVDQELSEDEQKVFRGMLKGYSATKISDIFDISYLKVSDATKKIKGLRLEY